MVGLSSLAHAPTVGPTEDAEHVSFPSYDRDSLVPAVVHLGVGGFHRAHQAVYFDHLAASGCSEWGVVGVGISRPELGEVLEAQDHLFLVVERQGDRSRARVVGSMVDYLLLADDPAAVTERMADPQTRLVTMTITADGYRVDDEMQQGDSVFVPVVEALDNRRQAGVAPFTVLSCDNLPDSGAAARRAVLAVAARRSPELVEWIDANVCFPSSMVDRITPSTSDEVRDQVQDEFNIDDGWPVVTEEFSQWVIEDCFSNDRPQLDRVGARFVDDVAPYKLIKSRLLNGTHCALGYLGYLAGYRRTDEAMADPQIDRFITALMRDEVAPLLPGDVAGMELDGYQRDLLERFGNTEIGDQLARLCGRGSTKMVDYVLPSVHEAQDRPHRLLTLVVAAWCRYLQGTDLQGEPIEVKDARRDELQPLARTAGEDARPFLEVEGIFGDLARGEQFCAEINRLVRLLDERGVQAAIATCFEDA
ncbi:MAG: mannitol dehydrogenase family protein [Jatrophihabitans sp.]|uniref:mannitol dehydrogenase family protein n=1 Tax=Jatrophihabitans sp. TaxID=1932789 RepID=UPI00390E5EE7